MIRLILIAHILFLFSCGNKNAKPKTVTWDLIERKTYTYHINAVGLPDSMYVKTYKYKDLAIIDSVREVIVHEYSNDKLAKRTFFVFHNKTGFPMRHVDVTYTYSGSNLASVVTMLNGKLVGRDNYAYDTANRLSNMNTIKSRTEIKQVEDLAQSQRETADIPIIYDSLYVSYVYDNSGKNVGATFRTPAGKIVRKDINIYSGKDPLASYNLTGEGDTVQRTQYTISPNGRIQSRIENDTMTYLYTYIGTTPISEQTLNRSANEEFKVEKKYADGRLSEESRYRMSLKD